MSNQSVGNVYQQIIREVVESSRVDFEEGGVDESVLDELARAWQQKLSGLSIATFPWDPKPEPPPDMSYAQPQMHHQPPQAMQHPGQHPSQHPSQHPGQRPMYEQHPGSHSSQVPHFPQQMPHMPQMGGVGIKTEPGLEGQQMGVGQQMGMPQPVMQQPGMGQQMGQVGGGAAPYPNNAAQRAAQAISRQYGASAAQSIQAIQQQQQQQQQHYQGGQMPQQGQMPMQRPQGIPRPQMMMGQGSGSGGIGGGAIGPNPSMTPTQYQQAMAAQAAAARANLQNQTQQQKQPQNQNQNHAPNQNQPGQGQGQGPQGQQYQNQQGQGQAQQSQQQQGQQNQQNGQANGVIKAQVDGGAETEEEDRHKHFGVMRSRGPDGKVNESQVEIDGLIREQIEARGRAMEGGGLMLPMKEHNKRSRVKISRQRRVTPEEDKTLGGGDANDSDDEDKIKDEDDEDAINSDLDDPDEPGDDDSDDDATQWVMLCMYDKVQRVKNKWKCVMKDGVLTINGKDYVFHKASGEYEW